METREQVLRRVVGNGLQGRPLNDFEFVTMPHKDLFLQAMSEYSMQVNSMQPDEKTKTMIDELIPLDKEIIDCAVLIQIDENDSVDPDALVNTVATCNMLFDRMRKRAGIPIAGDAESFCDCPRGKGIDYDENGKPYCIDCGKPIQTLTQFLNNQQQVTKVFGCIHGERNCTTQCDECKQFIHSQLNGNKHD